MVCAAASRADRRGYTSTVDGMALVVDGNALLREACARDGTYSTHWLTGGQYASLEQSVVSILMPLRQCGIAPHVVYAVKGAEAAAAAGASSKRVKRALYDMRTYARMNWGGVPQDDPLDCVLASAVLLEVLLKLGVACTITSSPAHSPDMLAMAARLSCPVMGDHNVALATGPSAFLSLSSVTRESLGTSWTRYVSPV
jgi:hypothetical protein